MKAGDQTALADRLGWLWDAWQFLFGYDVFISYKWSDSAKYAQALQKRLEAARLVVFLDRKETPGGVPAREYIGRRLLRSRALVVIATSDAVAEPKEITAEISAFSKRHPSRARLGIQFDGELSNLIESHDWHAYFHQLTEADSLLWHAEANGRAALANALVSDGVIEYITRSTALLSRGRLSRLMALSITVVTLFLAGSWGNSVSQRLEVGQQNLATSRGFEAIDRSADSPIDALVVAADSLSIRDTFAGRRAAAVFWSVTSKLTAATKIYMQSPLAVKPTPEGGLDVIGSAGFTFRLKSDLSVPQRALVFNLNSGGKDVSDWATAADAAGGSEFLLGTRLGKVISINPDTGAARCNMNLEGAEVTAIDALPLADGQQSDWFAIGSDCRGCGDGHTLSLVNTTGDVTAFLPLSHPQIVQTVQRLPGRNCLLAAGKDSGPKNTSLSLIDVAVDQNALRIVRESPLKAESRFHLDRKSVLVLPGGADGKGGYLAVIDEDATLSDCNGTLCSNLVLYSLNDLSEVSRLTEPSLNLVSFLTGDDIKKRWLVLADSDGNSWLLDLDAFISGSKDLIPLLQSGPMGPSRDEAAWRNHDALAFALPRPGNRVLLVGAEGSLFEIALPDGQPRFGSRIDTALMQAVCAPFSTSTLQQTTEARRAKICKALAGRGATSVVGTERRTWLFLKGRQVEVLDASGSVLARGETPITDALPPDPLSDEEIMQLSQILDGVPDPAVDSDAVWTLRSDGALLYAGLQNGVVVSRIISYCSNAIPVVSTSRIISLCSSTIDDNRLEVLTLADGRKAFAESQGPVSTIRIQGKPLAGIAIPETPRVFVVVRWNERIGFQLVDLDQSRVLSPPILLSTDDVWGQSEGSIAGLPNLPPTNSTKASLTYDQKTETVKVTTPIGVVFDVPMGWHEWHKSIADVVAWKPELGAASALGLDPGDYPLRPQRAVTPSWKQQCEEIPGPSQMENVLRKFMPKDPGAALLSGPSTQNALSQLQILFPPDAPGCPSREE